MGGYEPPSPAWGRRRRIYWFGIIGGVLAVLTAWVLVISGRVPAHDASRVTAPLVVATLFTPFFALWDNPGERRSWRLRLSEFVYCWMLLSGVVQTAWELPWLALDATGTIAGANGQNGWLWLWWAYANADTRYLTSDPTVFAVELCAALAGPLEILACIWFKRGRRIVANWLALVIGAGLTWGTIIFMVAEARVGFAHVSGGAFGFWVEWVGLNLPWAVAPFFLVPGVIYDLGALYEARGAVRAAGAARQVG